MYISGWLIFVIVVGAIYFFSRSKNRPQIENLLKPSFSYKLDISIEPGWYEIYKRLSGEKSEEALKKRLDKKVADGDSDLWHRRYHFTEYYDSVTGLTTRFQRVFLNNGKQYFYPADKFGDRGFIFESDIDFKSRETDEDKAKQDRLSVQVGEDFIRSSIFDKYIGGPRSDFDYEESDYVFKFPLYETFNFLLTLGTRFHQAEQNVIIKWPEYLEKKFKELGIEYETIFDHEPSVFDIEKYDKELYEKLGKPKISSSSKDSQFFSTYLKSKENGTHYSVDLKIFRPEENDRIGEFPPRLK